MRDKILNHKLRRLIEEYQRKKWFPEKYPDPLDELVDFINQETVDALIAEQQPFVAYYLHSMIPLLQFREQYRDYLQAQKAGPRFPFYHVQLTDEPDNLWATLRDWCIDWKSALQGWLKAVITHEKTWKDPIPLPKDLESQLRSTRDIFEWQKKQFTSASTLPELLRFFRMPYAQSLTDWNDFAALAKFFAETCHISALPKFRKSDADPAVQFAYPIDPPHRVLVEFGDAAGPLDAVRFLHEFAKGCFYSGMDASLPAEYRICGDPSLPLFWGFLYAGILTTATGLHKLVNERAAQLEPFMQFGSEFRTRYDAAMALYRSQVDSQLKDAQDFYVLCFETAFPIRPSAFLYLYELDRATEAQARYHASAAASLAMETLQTKYGRDWFASPRWAKRAKDYWREGFRLTLQDTLNDLA